VAAPQNRSDHRSTPAARGTAALIRSGSGTAVISLSPALFRASPREGIPTQKLKIGGRTSRRPDLVFETEQGFCRLSG